MSAERARHEALNKELQAHAYRYYVLDDPTVSDADYDRVYRELVALEKAHPELVHPGSITQRVGSVPRSDLQKYERKERMFSLDNAYGEADLRDFDDRVKKGLPDGEAYAYVAEPKLDGASLEVVYEIEGTTARLVLATTRGDGKTGEIVTENIRTIRGLPLTFVVDAAAAGKTKVLTLRGEVVIYRKDLETINTVREQAGEEPFMNPRNAAAGSLRMIDPREVAKRPLRLALYHLVEGDKLHATHAETLAWMAGLGLPTHRREVRCASLDEVLATIARFDREREHYPFETDGVVVKIDSYRQHGVLGETAKFPRWAVAYKFPAERARTVVQSIEIQVGRTGAVTPVANLDPVLLGGTTVSRASLHNFEQVAALDVRVGDTVEIEKAGEIIPQVMSVIVEKRPVGAAPFVVPTACPECGGALHRDAGEVALRCTNPRCPAIVTAAIHYYARRFAMDIDNLGHVLVTELVKKGLVADVADLYDLDVPKVAALPRMAKKSAENVLKAIVGSKERTFDRLLCALGIPQIGQVAAKQLAEVLPSLDEALSLGAEGVAERAGHIHGFGPAMIDALRAYFADPASRSILEKLQARGVSRPFQPAQAATTGPLLDKSFCVTGVLSKKREEVHEDIRNAGGTVHDSVKAGTTYLVAGDKTGASKLEAAKKRGTQVIDEAQLYALIAGG